MIDEPSAFIDVEERLTVAKAIRKVAEVRKTTIFVVDHDLLVADYISDRVMVFEGVPGREGHARSPADLRTGMNKFLESVQVTFRRDPRTYRPRINKPGSYLDRQQKMLREYYYVKPAQQPAEE